MRTFAATLLVFAATAAPAAAQATVTATPNTTGKGTKLHAELDATQPPVSGRLPTQTTLSVQKGFALDAKAVAKRCTAEQASGGNCPSDSKFGSATIVVTYNGSDIPVPIQLFLAKTKQAGDVADFQAVAEAFGMKRSVTGRIVKSTTDPYGLSVVLPSPNDLSAFPVTLKSLTADIGTSRVVKKKVGKGKKRHTVRKRHSFVRTPSTCTGSWASNATFTFSDGSTASIDAPIACVS